MILREVSVEQLRFTCGGCGQAWSVDYDVQHVEDGHGHDRDYYFHDGRLTPDPTSPGEVMCPRCGRTALIAVKVTARRATPVITNTADGDLGTSPDVDRQTERRNAPLLRGHAPAEIA